MVSRFGMVPGFVWNFQSCLPQWHLSLCVSPWSPLSPLWPHFYPGSFFCLLQSCRLPMYRKQAYSHLRPFALTVSYPHYQALALGICIASSITSFVSWLTPSWEGLSQTFYWKWKLFPSHLPGTSTNSSCSAVCFHCNYYLLTYALHLRLLTENGR